MDQRNKSDTETRGTLLVLRSMIWGASTKVVITRGRNKLLDSLSTKLLLQKIRGRVPRFPWTLEGRVNGRRVPVSDKSMEIRIFYFPR